MSSILKSSQDAERVTSESLLDEPPLKAQVSCRDGFEDPEQFRVSDEPRVVNRVPLGKAAAGLMDVDTFSSPPEIIMYSTLTLSA